MNIKLKSLEVSVIVARAGSVIGHNNAIPWQGRLPADLAYFRQVTYGQPVIMGRKTYESLPPNLAPLKGRRNIILSRDSDYDPSLHSTRPDYQDNVPVVVSGYDSAMLYCLTQDFASAFVIGGAQIYKKAMGHEATKTVYVTEIGCVCEGDTFFDDPDPEVWERYLCWPHMPFDDNTLTFSWDVYRRKA